MFLPVGLPTDDVPYPRAEHALHDLIWGTGRRGLNFVFNVCGSGFASPLYLRVLQEAALATTQRRASVLPIDGTGGGAWEAGTQTRGPMANGPFWSVKVGPSAGIPTGTDRWDGWVDVYVLYVCVYIYGLLYMDMDILYIHTQATAREVGPGSIHTCTCTLKDRCVHMYVLHVYMYGLLYMDMDMYKSIHTSVF